MRASKKFGLAAIVGGAAAYAGRQWTSSRRQGSALGGASGSSTTRRSEQRTDAAATSRRSEFRADGDEVKARRSDQADLEVDVTADAAPLVAAERDALTVPGGDGDDHRRRDQTAGEEAQEIAAAQVRERRNGEGYGGEDFEDEDR